MNKPLVVYPRSSTNVPYLRNLRDQARYLDFASFAEVRKYNPPLAFMRVATCSDPEFLEAQDVETRLRCHGTRILNSVCKSFISRRKDICYLKLRECGLRTPLSCIPSSFAGAQAFIKDDGLKYPLICRVIDGMNGKGMYLVRDKNELSRAYSALRGKCMIVEYINTMRGGYHRKYRPYVLDDNVDMWEVGIDLQWIVNLAHGKRFNKRDFIDANKKKCWPTQWNELVLRVGKCLGLDVYALDVIQDPTNLSCIILDVNVSYGMTATPDMFPPDVQELRKTHYARIANYLCRMSGKSAKI